MYDVYFTTTERETEIVFRPEAWSRHEPSTLPASAHKMWREVEGHRLAHHKGS